MPTRPISKYERKRAFLEDAATEVVREAGGGAESAIAVERVARGFAAEWTWRMNRSAQHTELPGYLAFIRGEGQELSQWDDFDTFYQMLHESLTAEMIESGTRRRKAPEQASELLDGLAERLVRETWDESLSTAREMLS